MSLCLPGVFAGSRLCSIWSAPPLAESDVTRHQAAALCKLFFFFFLCCTCGKVLTQREFIFSDVLFFSLRKPKISRFNVPKVKNNCKKNCCSVCWYKKWWLKFFFPTHQTKGSGNSLNWIPVAIADTRLKLKSLRTRSVSTAILQQ